MEEISIRRMEDKDISEVVYLHQKYMKHSFIKFLGTDFLRLLWGYLTSTELGKGLILEFRKEVVGFIYGAFNSDMIFKKFLIYNWYRLLRMLFCNLDKTRYYISTFLESLKYKKYTILKSGVPELLFITIHPKFRKKGWGKKLLFKELEEFKDRGYNVVKVTTVEENRKVNNFLKNLGFKVENRFKSFKNEMLLYSFKL